MSQNIAILGAGVSGLSAAYALTKKGHKVTMFESGEHVGGVMRSTLKDGYLAEHGPNSIMLNDVRIKTLIEELELTDRVITADRSSAKRFIIKQGKPCPMPYSLGSMLLNKVLTFPTKLRVACEPFIRRAPDLEQQSFADYVRHRLGDNMLQYAAGPFVNGIYAGDPEKLHFRLAFPRMYKIVDEHRSLILGMLKTKRQPQDPNKLNKRGIISFKNGMQELPEAFAKKLTQLGCDILTNASNSRIRSTQTNQWQFLYNHQGAEQSQIFEHIIVSAPAHKLDKIDFPESFDLSNTKKIYHPPVASILLGYKRSEIKHPLDGFGMLASLPEKTDILGALFTSTLFPEHSRAPQDHVAINVMLGGTRNPEPAYQPDTEMIATAHHEITKVLGISSKPVFSNVTFWNQAIPQISLNHQAVLDELKHAEESHPGIHLIGNYRGGISVGDSIINGLTLGNSL